MVVLIFIKLALRPFAPLDLGPGQSRPGHIAIFALKIDA